VSSIYSECKGKKSAKRRRENRQKASEEADIPLQTLVFLRETEDQRRKDNKEREENKNTRAAERNDLLREFLGVLKN
jgi:hypothetical protein